LIKTESTKNTSLLSFITHASLEGYAANYATIMAYHQIYFFPYFWLKSNEMSSPRKLNANALPTQQASSLIVKKE